MCVFVKEIVEYFILALLVTDIDLKGCHLNFKLTNGKLMRATISHFPPSQEFKILTNYLPVLYTGDEKFVPRAVP